MRDGSGRYVTDLTRDSFTIFENGKPQVVERFATDDIIASSSPYRISYARLAPSLINNEREVEESMRVLRAMA